VSRCLKEKQELETLAAAEYQQIKWSKMQRRAASMLTPEEKERFNLQQEEAYARSKPENFLWEPVRDCLFGVPGAGKSTCIKLLQRFFREVMHWESGVQFRTLAFQNTMAALIEGATVHKWGTIPICGDKAMEKMQGGGKKEATISDLFVSCTGMRWLIIDEVSILSSTLLGLLDAYLRRACTTFPQASRQKVAYMFGGINVIFAGDLWQLQPVNGRSFFDCPYVRVTDHGEQKMLHMFWKKGEHCIQKTWL